MKDNATKLLLGLVVLNLFSIDQISAQGINRQPMQTQLDQNLKIINVKTEGVKTFELLSPTSGVSYELGSNLVVNPYFNPAGDRRIVNYYLVNSKGIPHLLALDSWDWCGTGRRLRASSQPSLSIRLDKYVDNSLIKPGSYTLVIAFGQHGQANSSSTISGEELARSKQFSITPGAKAVPSGTVSGKVSIEFDPSAKLSQNAREEFFSRIIAIYLDSRFGSRQVKISPSSDGSFDLNIEPGTYTAELRLAFSGSDRHAFFQRCHFLMRPAPPKTIEIKSGQTLRLNYRLADNDLAGGRRQHGWLNYSVVPE